MTRFLAPAFLMFALLSGVPAQAATAVMSDPLRILENDAPLINQTKDRAIVKVAEWCGTGSFRDEYGRCRYYGYGAPLAPPHEACPPDRHFVPWVNHSGGRCVPNY